MSTNSAALAVLAGCAVFGGCAKQTADVASGRIAVAFDRAKDSVMNAVPTGDRLGRETLVRVNEIVNATNKLLEAWEFAALRITAVFFGVADSLNGLNTSVDRFKQRFTEEIAAVDIGRQFPANCTRLNSNVNALSNVFRRVGYALAAAGLLAVVMEGERVELWLRAQLPVLWAPLENAWNICAGSSFLIPAAFFAGYAYQKSRLEKHYRALEQTFPAGNVPPAAVTIPTGTIAAFGGKLNAVPRGWLPCDGRLLYPTELPNGDDCRPLFFLLQEISGQNIPVTLPDLRNRVPQGAGLATVGSRGGSSEVTIGLQHLPPHDHGGTHKTTSGLAMNYRVVHAAGPSNAHDHATGYLPGQCTDRSDIGYPCSAHQHKFTIPIVGEGTALPLPLPPYCAVNFIIKL